MNETADVQDEETKKITDFLINEILKAFPQVYARTRQDLGSASDNEKLIALVDVAARTKCLCTFMACYCLQINESLANYLALITQIQGVVEAGFERIEKTQAGINDMAKKLAILAASPKTRAQ